MPSLNVMVAEHTAIRPEEAQWLRLLVADWQIIADLSFADLVLWLPDKDGNGFWAGAQMRPTTGPTSHVDDIVGTFMASGRRPMLDQAYAHGRLVREGDPEWRDDVPVRVETIPVRRGDRVIAVIGRNTNLLGVRTPSRLELSYLQTAGDLTRMIAAGHFPAPGQRSDHADSPRVGDGFVRVDAEGRVTYASPNALSVYRRLGLSGDLTGLNLADLTRRLVPARSRADEETFSAVLGGRAHRDVEIGGEVSLILRSIPLLPGGERTGALILLRDVTELRRRDRELITKDATIREIHHRVKNNLQTVAALLRMQARRIDSEPARLALEEAVHRVGSIAIVHETLSQADEEKVGFDEVFDRVARMVCDVGAVGAEGVAVRRVGRFGELPSEVATPLSMVLTEILQNAVEHGFSDRHREVAGTGEIEARVERAETSLTVTVTDRGKGLPAGFDLTASKSLGLSIVRTLVETELLGDFTLGPATAGGTRAQVTVPLPEERP